MTIPLPTGNKLQVLLIGALIVVSFIIGSLLTKVQYLEKSGILGNTAGGVTGAKQGAGSGSGTVGTGRPSFGSAQDVEKLRKDDHVRGDRNAQILLIEYSDLECPFCKRFHPIAQKIVDEYKGKVAWVYRHFPLDQLHSKADKEAEAIECANELAGEDGFWKLTDKIFEVAPSNNGLDLATLPDLASQVGLDRDAFQACLDSGKMAAHVEADYQSGVKAGVTGTPGNILLDAKSGKTKLIPGALPFDQFKIAIDEILTS